MQEPGSSTRPEIGTAGPGAASRPATGGGPARASGPEVPSAVRAAAVASPGAAPMGGADNDVPDRVQLLVPLRRPLAILDLEATGTAPHRDRIVEIAVLRVFPDGRKDRHKRRLNPGMPIPFEATEIHGIRDQDVAGEPEFRHIAQSLAAYLEGCDLAGFGIVQFDLPLLRTEFDRAGVEFDVSDRFVIDAKSIYHNKEPRNLAAAHEFYCGSKFEAAHSAEADAVAAYRVLRAQMQHYGDLPRTLEELHRMSNPRQADFIDSEGKLIWRNGEVTFNFGKHRGVPLREVCVMDLEYVRWLIAKDFRADFKSVLAQALEGRYPEPKLTPAPPLPPAEAASPEEPPEQDHVQGPRP